MERQGCKLPLKPEEEEEVGRRCYVKISDMAEGLRVVSFKKGCTVECFSKE